MMKNAVTLLCSLAIAGCGGSGDEHVETSVVTNPAFVGEAMVVNADTPVLSIRGGSAGTITMTSGQRISLIAKSPILATVDNFSIEDLRTTETSVSGVFKTNVATTIRVQAFPPDNGPTAESPVNPPDSSRAVSIIVNLKAG